MLLTSEHTPCEVLFDTLKKKGGISHKELAPLVLSNRPLGDGRSPIEHAKDRTWLSHAIVHAPVGAQQERYFADYGVAAVRILNALQSRKSRALDAAGVLAMLSGDSSTRMQQALVLCHQDANLYRNVLSRLVEQGNLTPDECAEDCLVLFVAAGCSANAQLSAAYALNYAQEHNGEPVSTPQPRAMNLASESPRGTAEDRTLGIVRVVDGYVAGDVHWVYEGGDERGLTIGAFATGSHDVTEVGDGVSGEHARIWRRDDGTWLVEDLGSTNGTTLLDGATGRQTVLTPHVPYSLRPGDELQLAGTTTYSVIQGWA